MKILLDMQGLKKFASHTPLQETTEGHTLPKWESKPKKEKKKEHAKLIKREGGKKQEARG